MTFGSHSGLFGEAHECRTLHHSSLSGLYAFFNLHARAVGVAERDGAFHIHMVAFAYEHECLTHLLDYCVDGERDDFAAARAFEIDFGGTAGNHRGCAVEAEIYGYVAGSLAC